MTLDEARTIWLTLLGSDWVSYIDVLESPYYETTVGPAYRMLRMHNEVKIHAEKEMVKLKCKS